MSKPIQSSQIATHKLIQQFVKQNFTNQDSETLKKGVVSIQYLSNSMYVGYIDRNKKRNGNGVYRYSNKDVYMGQWNEDNFDGNGIYVFANGNKFEGEFLEGECIKGKYYYKNGDEYHGEMKNGLKQGKGSMKYYNGNFYSGSWHEDQRHGQGEFECKEYLLKGLWENDRPNGHGTIKANNLEYNGIICGSILVKGQINITFYERQQYFGEIFQSKMHGKGKYTSASGWVYEGDFFENQYHGKGILHFPDNSRYQGDFKHSQIAGKGKLYYNDGQIYQGQWKNNEKNGLGIIKYANNDVYEGNFFNGKKNGNGKYLWNNIGKRFQGIFNMDQIISGQIYDILRRKQANLVNFSPNIHIKNSILPNSDIRK